MQLSRLNLPSNSLSTLTLPEKVLQFGTGVLLRALPDYFIHKANAAGIFGGRVIVVKSTTEGDPSIYAQQDNLYTICARGIENGQEQEEAVISTAISRVLYASTQWPIVLETARQLEVSIIISNTTEVGISYVEEDVHQGVPSSYPGKLLAWLLERWRFFKGDPASGTVIIPTELITGNGDQLKNIVLKLAHYNQVSQDAIAWIITHNAFCNSLVDRIVPGRPKPDVQKKIEEGLGYHDDLLTMCEVFRLWAIQGDEKIKEKIGFHSADEGLVIVPDIDQYKELKLRLLNGTHSFCCGPAFLSDFGITRDAVADPQFSVFMHKLMDEEISPSIPYTISVENVQRYGRQVRERFANPYIDHPWINITLQYSSKMRMRNLPLLERWYTVHDKVPMMMATSFAAYIFFTKPVTVEAGVYYGVHRGEKYPIKDDHAKLFMDWWASLPADILVDKVMKSEVLWGKDLSQLPGFKDAVIQLLKGMLGQGVSKTIQHMISR
ncbi:MAG: tagaturonate reductase [Sphingobacteriales bacterium]|nr:MAG: tagaturonate reductase [Sphingobacteriales bacterium]